MTVQLVPLILIVGFERLVTMYHSVSRRVPAFVRMLGRARVLMHNGAAVALVGCRRWLCACVCGL